MINKDQCGIVRDLIPLVIDDVASEESKKLVEAHLPECPGCSSIMNDMRAEIEAGQVNEKDERFVQLCLKVRRALSWKRTLMIFVTLAVAVGLLAGGTAYARYKMYVDWREYMPQQYQVTVDKDGLLVFEYASDGRHGYCGYGYGFDKEGGVFYITPHISSWPQIFDHVDASNTDVFNDIRLRDGKLVYVESITTDEQIFDEASGRYQWKESLNRKEITELRIGTPGDYQVAFRSGDTLPIANPGAQDTSAPQTD